MLTLPLGISPRKLLPQGSGSTQRVKTRGFDYIPQRAGKSSQTSFLERKLGKELFLRARGGSLTLALIEPVTHARGTMPPEGRTQKSWAKNFFFAPGAARWRSRSSNRSRTRAGLPGKPQRKAEFTYYDSFQISRLYSATERSEEKYPALAMLMSIFLAQASRSS